MVIWSISGSSISYYSGEEPIPELGKGAIQILQAEGLLWCENIGKKNNDLRCTLTNKAYEAVDTNFNASDTSFVKHLTPLADITNLDKELKERCLPILGAGSADEKMWDSAVRVAGVILEERLRDVGNIEAGYAGQDIVNKVFKNGGTLASKFSVDSERQGYRDLYAGVFATFRNPSAHRLVDPTPEEGGAFIVFVNLLLKKLEDLR
ncbi:MAG: TIGR02391 family protein [Symplocastrum torsivum CPER-KK1]|uniref:TIGR02391 family protein n=1 Tax=Symplocastrum torsivum CPER-KK1 TaxID=450513 RepID=A0A951PJM7_9CYAN|nr:TIGR02391 family protein [Symplocastrum torsivum CPER-KK1]